MVRVLTKTGNTLILKRGSKAGYLFCVGYVMFLFLLPAGGLLFVVSDGLNMGWWALLFLPLLVWGFWFLLSLLLSEGAVAVYKLDKSTNQATMEIQSFRSSTISELVLDDIRSAEVKPVGMYGRRYAIHILYLLMSSRKEIAFGRATGLREKRELEEIARYVRAFIF
jgi:hypothetical protein